MRCVACFTLLTVILCDTRVIFPVLKNVTWRKKVRKSGVSPPLIKLIRRVKFISANDSVSEYLFSGGQNTVVDLDPLFNGRIFQIDPRSITACFDKSGKTGMS